MSDTSDEFYFAPDASAEEVRALLTAIRSKIPETYPRELPETYFAFLLMNDGGEGFVGEEYFILWRAADLMAYNEAYEVAKHAPGLFIFGSEGGGEAYAFDLREPGIPIVKVPFVGMALEHAEVFAENFEELLAELQQIAAGQADDADDDAEPPPPPVGPRDTEIWDITPIMLGGDPEDPKNKTRLDRPKHIQAVRYWNKVISDLRAKESGS